MNVKLLNQILSALPDPALHKDEHLDVYYTEAFTSFNVMPDKDNIRSNALHPSMRMTFRRIYNAYGYDWQVVDIEKIKKG